MKFLVTGGAGFVGSHLIQALLELGHSIECVDNLSTGTYQNVALFRGHPNYRFHRAAIEHFPEMESLVSTCDAIFHLAASVGVKNIVANPIECIENNVFGTSLMLKLADRFQKRILTFSTSEVYGKSQKFPFAEEDDIVLGPVHKLRWAYAGSKLIDDYLAQAYFVQRQTPVTIVRLFNTIGQRQVGHYGMVVPRFFESAMSARPLTVHGTGEQRRCFTDVRDVVGALLAILPNKATYGELINIGTPNEISINQLASLIKDLARSSSEIQHISYEAAYGKDFEDMERRVPSNAKLTRLTDFKFKYTLKDTLAWIHQEFLLRNSLAERVSGAETLNLL